MSVATGLALSGPGAGALTEASRRFTIRTDPVGSIPSASDVVTPSSAGGTFMPTTVTLDANNLSALVTFIPLVQGPQVLTLTDTLALAAGFTPVPYLVAPPPFSMKRFSTSADNPLRKASLSVVPGDWSPLYLMVADCPALLTAGALFVKLEDISSTFLLNVPALVVDPGTQQADGSYTAILLFNITETLTAALTPGHTYSFNIAGVAAGHMISLAVQGLLTADAGGSATG